MLAHTYILKFEINSVQIFTKGSRTFTRSVNIPKFEEWTGDPEVYGQKSGITFLIFSSKKGFVRDAGGPGRAAVLPHRKGKLHSQAGLTLLACTAHRGGLCSWG